MEQKMKRTRESLHQLQDLLNQSTSSYASNPSNAGLKLNLTQVNNNKLIFEKKNTCFRYAKYVCAF